MNESINLSSCLREAPVTAQSKHSILHLNPYRKRDVTVFVGGGGAAAADAAAVAVIVAAAVVV